MENISAEANVVEGATTERALSKLRAHRAGSRQASPDQVSEQLAAIFGHAVMMLMGSPTYRDHALADLEWLIVPAIAAGQLRMIKSQIEGTQRSAPAGLVIWAKVSDAVDERLQANVGMPLKLGPGEWKSGDTIWIVDAVGEPPIIEGMLRQLAEKEWSGSKVKLRARGKNGEISVGLLEKRDVAPI